MQSAPPLRQSLILGSVDDAQASDLDAGDGNKRHHSSCYEYTNVQPPPL
jgi:hypothetical protein